ncbi:MAG: endolytic transglycosylase MltG [Candidatus Saccharicenans sp.]|nr:endolytic transglycosylase MltG [Candidatus Saccharicenans sp.]MDI6849972.1 endolytic transglycosylase MltG [Candidatus Saccharicenans sp.]
MLTIPRKAIEALIFILAIANLGLACYLALVMNSPLKDPAASGKNVFIEKGQSLRGIARGLKKEQVIKSDGAFRLSYSLYFSPRFLRAGEYRFEPPLTPKRIMLQMISGQIMLHPITIPEGLTFTEISALLEEKAFPYQGSFLDTCRRVELVSDLDPKADNLEGYLFPETYRFARGVEAIELVKAMIEQFRKNFGPEDLARAGRLNLTVREIVTLASLIEKETSKEEEKPLVSAVFHNRLRLGMKLDCDPTIIYALKLQGRFDGNLRLKDKSLASPYNTYLYRGLPPGPICNPGRASLQAALHPAPVDYLYFVSRNDGSHVFNRSYQEHLRAVSKYQLKNHRNLR